MLLILSLVFAHLLAVISPGPDTLIIIKQNIRSGFIGGLFTSLGIAIGIFLHCLLAMYGISSIVLANNNLETLVTVLAAIYFIYLGISSLSVNLNTSKTNERTLNNPIIIGFITNILNIKAFIFFVSIFAVIASYEAIAFDAFFIIYFPIATFIWFVFLSYLLNVPIMKEYYLRKNKIIDHFLGYFLILLGIFLLINNLWTYLN